MPTPTYTPLANITLGSSAASVTFSSMTAGFKDYVVIADITTSGSGDILINFNSDTSSTYATVYAYGGGSGSGSSSTVNTTSAYIPVGSAHTFNQISIMDATATDKHKTILARSGDSAGTVEMIASRWPSTSAITSIKLAPSGGTFITGSSFSLYGIAA